MSDECPDENTLIDFARGGLSQRGKQSVETHLDGCARCRVAVAALAKRVSVHSAEVAMGTLPPEITQPENQHPAPGFVLAQRFRLINFLGVGAMGVVYEADDLQLGERVAIKVLASQIASRSDVLDFLRREISLGRRVSHPNVCPVYDMGISDSHHFITMKLVEGVTLDQRLDEGRLAPKDIELVLTQLARALAAAHLRGVVHRDLKSANVMVTKELHVWVMDFGLARDLERDPSYSGPVGTPAYWSPEQALGETATPASDVFSFGVIAYRLWTGKLPRRHKEKTVFSDIPRPWKGIVERCLAEREALRYANGSQLVEAIEGSQRRSRPVLIGLGALGLVASGAAGAYALLPVAATPPTPSLSAPTVPLAAPVPDAQVPVAVVDNAAADPIIREAAAPTAAGSTDAGPADAGNQEARPKELEPKKNAPKAVHVKPRPADDIPLFE